MATDFINRFDWPDQAYELDGYDMKTVPAFTQRNFIYLVECVNELASKVAKLTQKDGDDDANA